MSLRRILVTAPFGLVVAVVAHALAFGEGHVLGAGFHGQFLALAFAGSALAALAAFVALSLGGPDWAAGERRIRSWLPGAGGVGSLAAALCAGGIVSFGLIETAEGRSAFGSPVALVALVLVAVGAAIAVRAVSRWVARAGAAVASALTAPVAISTGWSTIITADRFIPALAPLRGTSRGRAPPHFA